MKILASVPVEKVGLCAAAYTFRNETIELVVVRVIRTPATRYAHLNRWYYAAHVRPHPAIHADGLYRTADGLFLVNINRHVNKDWRPPEFCGRNVFEVPA